MIKTSAWEMVIAMRLFYFKSLGLDITSVLFNPFKMAATYPFCDFYERILQDDGFPRETLWIEKV